MGIWIVRTRVFNCCASWWWHWVVISIGATAVLGDYPVPGVFGALATDPLSWLSVRVPVEGLSVENSCQWCLSPAR